MLFPLHSTRRTQCTPITLSKQALHLAKLNLSSISAKTVISFLIEISRRLDALSTPSYAPNAVHTDFIVKQFLHLAKLNLSSISAKTVISSLLEIFRCFFSLSTPFYAPNVVHSYFCVETIPATRKTQSFHDFGENSYIVPD
jgi:hypothetical protein